jgi:hypothetical protein
VFTAVRSGSAERPALTVVQQALRDAFDAASPSA